MAAIRLINLFAADLWFKNVATNFKSVDLKQQHVIGYGSGYHNTNKSAFVDHKTYEEFIRWSRSTAMQVELIITTIIMAYCIEYVIWT